MKRTRVAAASAAAMILGAGGAFAADLDTMATKAPVYKAPANTTCTSIVDFFTTACQLSAYGVRLYGTVDVGFGYQTAGAPFNKDFPTGASYFLQKMNRQAMWGLAPNGLSQSNIGLQVVEPIAGGWKFVGQYDAGFDPYSFQWANGPGSLADNIGKPTALQTTNADSGRNGAFDNGQLFAGVSNDIWGTLTVGRQNSFTLDGVNAYDPMGGAYAFSPIGFSGKVPGGGNTEDTRYNASVRYKVNVSNYRFGALVEFGGIDAGNGAEQAFELDGGGDWHVGPGVFSFDVVGGYMKDAVNLGLGTLPGTTAPVVPGVAAGAGGSTGANDALSATISDNTNVMVLGKYTIDRLKLYAGYEWVHYAPSSDFNSFVANGGPQSVANRALTAMDGANTGFNPVTLFANQANQIFQVAWGGARYSITDSVDVAAAYYLYTQNDGTAAPGVAAINCSNPLTNSACRGQMNAASAMIDWKFAPKWDTYIGTFYSSSNGGLNSGYLSSSNLATTAGIRFRF
jgi:predicted porin